MKTLILDGIFVFDDLTSDYDNKRSIDIIYEKAKKDNFDRYILIQNGKISSIPDGIKNVTIDSTKIKDIFEIIQKEIKQSNEVIFLDVASPFYDSEFINSMFERHNNYLADYTYSIGYPLGLVPTLVKGEIIKELYNLVSEDHTITKEYLFYALSKDINSFDIETFISNEDLRIYRLKFGANDVGEKILTKNIFDQFGDSYSYDEINSHLKDNLDKLYTVPYMLGVELTTKTKVNSIYYPTKDVPNNDIETPLFKDIVNQFKKINGNFHLVLGGLGDPILHNNFFEIVRFLNEEKIDTIIETYGLDIDESFLNNLDKIDKNLITFVIKIDSYYETTYNLINKGGNFNKAVGNYKELKKRGYKVYKQVIRIAENEEEIEKYIRNGEVEDLIIRKFSTYCKKLEDKKVVDLAPLERIPCFHLRRDIFVNSFGEVPFCCYAYDKIVGDLKKEPLLSIIDALNSHYKDNALSNYKPFCLDCDDYYIFNF